MSHIVSIQTEVRDVVALRAACRRLGLTEPVWETTRLFSGQATGHCVRLPGWRYPLVCNTTTGQLRFDNYGGRWGQPSELDRFLQAYACEITKIEARRKGHSVSEQKLADGSVKVTIRLNGGAA